MKELARESWNYRLTETEAGDLLLSVVSGSVGLYEVSIHLTADEISRYRTQGNSYLATLADEIRTHETRFSSRRVME